MEADIAAKAVELGTNTDFSLFSLFFRADIIVKSVMIILILCSIYSWAVIIEKFRLFKKITKSSEEFEEKFWNSKSAETFYNSLPSKLEDPMSLVFQDAMEGLLKKKSRTNISERMSASLESGIEKQMTNMTKQQHDSDDVVSLLKASTLLTCNRQITAVPDHHSTYYYDYYY